MYALVRSGGKQYRVEEGRAIKLDRLAGEIGYSIELGEVLLMGEGETITVGAPTIAGARVLGTIAEQGRARKIVVFRYKAKTRQRKKTGHRQHFTRIVVSDILGAGEEPRPQAAVAEVPAAAAVEAPVKPRRSRRKAEPEAAPPAEPVDATPAEATKSPASEPAAEAPASEAKPRRSRKKTTE